jgi:hypothetical protein
MVQKNSFLDFETGKRKKTFTKHFRFWISSRWPIASSCRRIK